MSLNTYSASSSREESVIEAHSDMLVAMLTHDSLVNKNLRMKLLSLRLLILVTADHALILGY